MDSIRIIIVMALFATFAIFFPSSVVANDKFGVVEYQKVLFQHPRWKEIVVNKQGAKMEEQELMAPLLKEINLAVSIVAKAKGLMVVYDRAQVFYGGINITNEVVEQVKKTNWLNRKIYRNDFIRHWYLSPYKLKISIRRRGDAYDLLFDGKFVSSLDYLNGKFYTNGSYSDWFEIKGSELFCYDEDGYIGTAYPVDN